MGFGSSLQSFLQMPSSEMQISDEMHAQFVSSQVCILKIGIMVFPRYGLLIVWLEVEDQNVWSICSQLWTEKYREKTHTNHDDSFLSTQSRWGNWSSFLFRHIEVFAK